MLKFVKQNEKWITYSETKRKAVKLCDTQWNRDESSKVWIATKTYHGCSNHLNLVMGAEYLTKTLSCILEFKYLQNKKWKKQAVKRTRRKKSYKTYWTIYLDNWEKLAIFLQKLSIFNIYYVFAPFVKLRECRFFYFFSLYDIRNEPIFLILEHSSLSGVNQKKSWKKH